MKKTLIAMAVAVAFSTSVLADTSSMNSSVTGMGILENDYVRAGVNGTAGTFGSGGNTSPGLLFDSTGTGTFNTGYDYLTPGSPFDGFSVKIDGTNYTNNNGGGTAITGDGNGLTDGDNALSWTGGVDSVFDITNTYSLGATSPYIDISSQITMGVDATDVYFGRFIDPDARAAAGDSSATDNVLGYGAIPDSNVAFSEATVSRYALGLYSTDSNVDAGISMWSTEADAYTENTVDGDGSLTNTGDNTIGLSWHWSSVSSGDILTASYAYIFGPSAFDAAGDAIEGGAGGGADILTGTFEDVGSATDAAESGGTPAAPTLVSTSDPVITYGAWGAWSTNTALPILTQSQTTHDASDDGKVQTIDRETTTIVTTPELRTRTSTTTVTDTYSDSSTIDRVTSTGTDTGYQTSSVTTVTDPGSFTGRVDQVATVQDVVNSALRVADFTRVGAVAMDNKYDNGMSGTTRGVVAGGIKVNENNIIVGGGVAKLNTDMTGNGDTVKGETTAVSGVIGKRTERGDITARVTHGMTDYEMTRTIGDFANAGITEGTDTSIALRFEGSSRSVGIADVSPILGVTRGKQTVDEYTETGSIQSARTVAETSENYTYGTVGASVDVGMFNLVALHNTNGVNDVSVGIERETEKVTWGIRVNKTMTDLGDTTSVTAGLSIKF
jgi:hypothetical protein